MKRTTVSLAAGLLLGLATTTAAAADAAAGKAKSATCAACHGQDGIGTAPIYPNLACQKEQYLVSALTAYKDGTRQNGMMAPMVASLTDADIANLAAYYATLNCD